MRASVMAGDWVPLYDADDGGRVIAEVEPGGAAVRWDLRAGSNRSKVVVDRGIVVAGHVNHADHHWLTQRTVWARAKSVLVSPTIAKLVSVSEAGLEAELGTSFTEPRWLRATLSCDAFVEPDPPEDDAPRTWIPHADVLGELRYGVAIDLYSEPGGQKLLSFVPDPDERPVYPSWLEERRGFVRISGWFGLVGLHGWVRRDQVSRARRIGGGGTARTPKVRQAAVAREVAPAIAQRDTKVRERPAGDAPVLAQLRAGSRVETFEAHAGFVRIDARLSGARPGPGVSLWVAESDLVACDRAQKAAGQPSST